MTDILPLVSIITPAYNRASYLDETINSVLGQDYPNIEYIVLDDGSTDNTREVLEKYSRRLIWGTHPNMGETRTVNKGWSMAKGEIVAVVNSDDPILPGAVSEAVTFMRAHPDILVAYPDWNMIGPNSEFLEHIQLPAYDYLYMLRRHHCIVGPGAFIRRRAFELTGMRDPELKYVADFEYWLRLGLYGKFARIPKTLATFRVHPDSASVSQKGVAMADEHIRMMNQFYARPDLTPEVHKVRAEAFSWAHLAAATVCGPRRLEATKHLIKSIRYNPLSFLLDFDKLTIALVIIRPKPLVDLIRKIWHAARGIWQKDAGFLNRAA